MLIRVTTAEVCDATKADSSNAVDPIIIITLERPELPFRGWGLVAQQLVNPIKKNNNSPTINGRSSII